MNVAYHGLLFKVEDFKRTPTGVIMLKLEGLSFMVPAEFVDIV